MRILMVWPGVALPGWNSLHTKASNEATYCNHGYMSMSAVLKKAGHTVLLQDMRDNTGWAQFEQCVRDTDYDIAVVGWYSCDHANAQVVCSVLKQVHPLRPVVAGGVHLSLTKIKSLPYVDCIVHGEGEYVLLDLVEKLSAGEPLPPLVKAEPILDLDALPFADRNLFDDEPERRSPLLPGLPAPNVTIVTSRGCFARCTFCAPSGSAIFGPRVRYRSVEHVIDELLQIKNAKGIGSVMFHSDLFGKTKWLEGFADAYGQAFGYLPFWCQLRSDDICKNKELMKGLADVGMLWVSCGFEHGSQRMLDFLEKGTTVAQNVESAAILHDLGVNIFANLLCGVPTETKEEMEETLKLAKKIQPAWWSCNSWAAFPGSYLYDYVNENNLLTDEHWSKWVYPYQRKVKGLDYEKIAKIQNEIRKHTRPVNPPRTHRSLGGACIPGSPDLSVIMRTYNRPEMLQKAVDSIIEQTFKNWELIIVDDGSICKGINATLNGFTDNRIKVIRNIENKDGHSILLNQGIDRASGRLIGFCDDDDMREPEWADIMVGQLNSHPEWDFALCLSRDVSPEGNIQIKRGIRPKDITEFHAENKIDLGEMVLRREVFDQVGMFDERLHYGEDWEFASRLIKAGIPGETVGTPLCIHTQHAGGQLYTRTNDQREFTKQIVVNEEVHNPYRIALFWPEESKLQKSQFQVVAGVRDAILRIPNISLISEGPTNTAAISKPKQCDLILVVVPFQCTLTELSALRAYGIPMVAILTEDPPAFNSNMANSVYFDWVISNDMSTVPYYEARAQKPGVAYSPEHVGFMPCLSVNTAIVGGPRPHKSDPKWDMVICGYMYDSRRDWMKRTIDKIDWNLLLVGRRWEEFSDRFEVLGDQGLNETMDIYSDSKIICCLNRQNYDDGTKIAFQMASRGYVEAYSGALVMIDNSRQIIPPFEDDEIVTFGYKNPDDFVQKAHLALRNDAERLRMGAKAQARAVTKFTYVARLTKLIRDIRGSRGNIRIP